MLTKTSLLAVRALIYLSQGGQGMVLSPKRIADALGVSPTYLAKVLRMLVRAGILRAEKGVKGGVFQGRSPSQITLLSIVEACQGQIVGTHCREGCDLELTCAYHRAAAELQQAMITVLSRWTVAQLSKRPRPLRRLPDGVLCVLEDSGRSAQVERHRRSTRAVTR